MKIKTLVFTCGVLGILFVGFGGASFGYSLKSCVFLALTGVFLGLVAAPEISPEKFRSPVAWQIFFCVAGFLVIAILLSLPLIGYFLAALLGVLAGYTAHGWVKHINIP